MPSPIGYGIVGAGARAACLAGYLARRKDEVFLRAVCEPNELVRRRFLASHGLERTVSYDDYDDLLGDEQVRWVIVTSPNACHRDHIIAAFRAGKHVFAEKPLATSIADCVEINEAHTASGGLIFATGFVLRYAPLYVKVKALLAAGTIGRIVSVAADENITAAHGGHIMTCWRRFSRLSGSHMLEKCCHDMDLLNWMIEALPRQVASFGGRDIFIPANAGLMARFAPPREDAATAGNGSAASDAPRPARRSMYLEWHGPTHDADNPFTSDKDIVDNQVAIIEYRNGVRATFQTVMSCAIPERRMYFAGTEGTLIAELYSGTCQVKRLGYDLPGEVYNFSGSMHGGGDERICEQLVESMTIGAAPACSGQAGLTSAVVSLGIEQARLDGVIVDLEPVWNRLGLGR